jgi:hypothetical protein
MLPEAPQPYGLLYYPRIWSGFGGLEVTCWPLVPKFAGSNPEFSGRKNPQRSFLGGEVKAVLSHIADLRHVKEL